MRNTVLAGAVGLSVWCVALAARAGAQSVEALLADLTRAIETFEQHHAHMAPYDVVFHRDPMRPLVDDNGQLVSTAGLQGGVSVQGVILSDAQPMVVVDDELVGPGQMVGSYRILEIRADGVVVQQPDARLLFIPLDRGVAAPQAPSVEFPHQ